MSVHEIGISYDASVRHGRAPQGGPTAVMKANERRWQSYGSSAHVNLMACPMKPMKVRGSATNVSPTNPTKPHRSATMKASVICMKMSRRLTRLHGSAMTAHASPCQSHVSVMEVRGVTLTMTVCGSAFKANESPRECHVNTMALR